MKRCRPSYLTAFLILFIAASLANASGSELSATSSFGFRDTTWVNRQNQFIDALIDSEKVDAAIDSCVSVLRVATQLHYTAGIANTKFMIGRAHIHKFDFAQGLSWIDQADSLYRQLNNERGIAECKLQSGVVRYYDERDFSGALKEFKNAEQIFTSLHDDKKASTAEYLSGLALIEMQQYDLAEQKLLAAEKVKKELNDEDGLYECHNGLADLYSRTKQYDKARFYYKECVEYFAKTNNPVGFATSAQLIESQNDLLTSQIRNRNIMMYLLIGFIVLMFALIFMIFQRFRFKQRTNKKLEEANAELKKTLEELKATQQQLIQAEKMASLGQLTAGIAHEINNPINFVSSSVSPLKRNLGDLNNLMTQYEEIISKISGSDVVENLKKEADKDFNVTESEKLLQGIEEGSNRTAEIVRGLRSFSRLDEEEMKEANINEGIESTLVLLHNKIKHQNIEVIKSLGELPLLHCYPGQLNQVFMNLLTNSIDAVENEGRIFITTSAEKKNIRISVRDTGKGMSKEVKQKIFDPFFTTKAVGKGTGLGLSISYGIIEKHKGTIEVKSEEGKGTEFIITLPILPKS